jgi:glycosyltransferase involved in cell wall biosynthesis
VRILFCNKYNYPFSGTEVYMFQAMELLRSRGHETALFSMADERGRPTPHDHHFLTHIDFKQQRGWFRSAKVAASAIYSMEARRRMRAMISDFRPDVAHVRNIYHHLSPSILWELRAQEIPIVYHLNDFKILCPNYNLLSHGEPCEACKGGKFWHVLREKCYPGSSARIVLVAEAYVHKWLGTYKRCVDCFLAPSQFVRDKFVGHGWDPKKFEVLPHFQLLAPVAARVEANAPLLYFGRLSREKGVDDLLRAMNRLPDLRLNIAGDGPERKRLQQLSAELGLSNVKFAGNLQGAQLEHAIGASRFTVLPSHAYETLGKTVLESYASARAVIATDLGSRRELVYPGKTGLLYAVGDVSELVSAIQLLASKPELAETMGLAGRELVQQRHTAEAHYEALIALYVRLGDAKRSSTTSSREGKQEFALIKNVKQSGDPSPDGSFVPCQHITLASVSPLPRNPPSPMAENRKLSVAFIGGRGVGSKYSGIETYYEEVGKKLVDMGHQVTAHCRTYFTPPGKEYAGMRLVRLPTIRSKHIETVAHTFLSTLHALVSRCDIVHYHALGPALFSFIPRLAGKKTLVTVQGLDWQRSKWGRIASSVLRIGERAAVCLPNQTMVVSQALQQYYRSTYGAETYYVPNGGVLRQWREPRKILDWGLQPGHYILFLGRFSPEKCCHVLIEAFEKLNTDVKLVLAGASSYCDEYSRQLRKHTSERIILLDWVSGDTLDELLTNAMLYVHPSALEGLSLALLDAMGAGLCVLTSDVPENQEAIEGAGFTFRCGDAADLADRLRFLIANAAVREAVGQSAKRRIQDHYQWSKIAAEVERVYFETMGWELPIGATPRGPSTRATQPAPEQRRVAG